MLVIIGNDCTGSCDPPTTYDVIGPSIYYVPTPMTV